MQLGRTLLVTACVLSFMMMFVVAVYAQVHDVMCKRGLDGPVGFVGPAGPAGQPALQTTSYVHANSLLQTLVMQLDAPAIYKLPGVGVPWKTFGTSGDVAIFSFGFGIVTPTPGFEISIALTVSASNVTQVFGTTDLAQTVTLNWARPAIVGAGVPHNIQIMLTRNSLTSVITTIVSGAEWTMTGGAATDVALSNVYVRDLNFITDDIFIVAHATIPAASPEQLVTYGSTVQFVRV